MDSDIGPSELSDIAEEPEEGLTDDTDDDQVNISSLIMEVFWIQLGATCASSNALFQIGIKPQQGL